MYDNRERAAYHKEREQFASTKSVDERRFDPKNSAKGPTNQYGFSPDSEKKAIQRQFTEKKPVYYKPEPARAKANTAVKQQRSVSAKRYTQPQ